MSDRNLSKVTSPPRNVRYMYSVRCRSNAHLRVCRRQLSLDAPPGVFYKIGAGACLGICKKKPRTFTVRDPVIFKGTFRLRVRVRVRAKVRARARVRVRLRVRVKARVRARARARQLFLPTKF